MKKIYASLVMLAPLMAMAEPASEPNATQVATATETSTQVSSEATSESDSDSSLMTQEEKDHNLKVKFLIANDAAAASQPSNTIVIQPTGRILMDAAAYATNDDEFKAGVAIPDVRAGVKARYGKWNAKVDVGYAFGKVGLKDLYMEYDFTPSFLLRAGNFVHQFGLQSATSSAMKVSMEEPTSNAVFNFSRLLGVMAQYDKGQFFGTFSLNVESNALTMTANQMGKTGYGGMTRLVWRPMFQDGLVAQIGMSFALQSPTYNSDAALNHKSVSVSANFPTRVNSIEAIGATVDNAKYSFRMSPELLLCYHRMALETQYYYMRVDRKDNLNAFVGYGAYAMLRGIAVGNDYKYSHADGGLATPDPKSLELVLLYNYTNLSNKDAGIMGGRVNEVSLTANWYINKWMIWRFRAGYTHRWDYAGQPDVDLGAFQTRLQIIF